MEYVYLLLLMGVVIALCVLINRATVWLKIPSLLLFIGLGMAFGVLFRLMGLGNFTDYALGNVVCSVCLVFVIFYGGFGTNFKEARPVAGRSMLLSFVGTAATAGLLGVCVYAVFRVLPFGEVGWLESMLVGAVLCSTDAASVFNILRSRRLNLKYRTSSLLEMESGSNDPMSYMLTAVFAAVLAAKYAVAEGEALAVWEMAVMLVSQIGFGAIFGVGFGFFGIFLLKKFSFNMGQGNTLFILALALISYSVPAALPGIFAGNGYLAAYICGLMIGNARIPQKRDCVRFFDALTGVAQMMIFFLLGLLATPEWLIRPAVLLPALCIFLLLTLLVRPIVAGGILLPFRARLNQIGVIGFAGLRGVASIVFAIYAVSILGENNLPYDLFSIVFCVVLFSIVLQGSLLPAFSKKLNMLGDGEDVLRTFTDYQDETDVCFVKVVVGETHPWAGKKLRECVMPKGFLIVLLLRGEEVIVPSGSTVVNAGDLLVTAAPEFENHNDFGLFEEYIGKNHVWEGKPLRELHLPQGTLIAMIKRRGGTVIPYGATVLREGDTLVCIKIPPKEEQEKADPAALEKSGERN